MSVSAVSGSAPAFQAPPPPTQPPVAKVKDKDGDYDNGKPEGGAGDKDHAVNIKA
jgi:hypothetical protein